MTIRKMVKSHDRGDDDYGEAAAIQSDGEIVVAR